MKTVITKRVTNLKPVNAYFREQETLFWSEWCFLCCECKVQSIWFFKL